MLSAVTAAAAASADDINADPGQTNANTGQFEANTGQDESAAVGFEAEHYALDYGVTGDEARRRLGRIPELKSIIQEIVAAEVGRVAGRGIVHEPKFGGWVYLVGDDQPTRATRDLLALHEDVFVDTGATYTFADLKTAMSDPPTFEAVPASIRDRIAYRDIDVRSNSIVVAIDRDQPPARTDGGDSGGPWFQDRTAYGIMSGTDSPGSNDCTAEGTDFAMFTAMDDILGDLDLELATT